MELIRAIRQLRPRLIAIIFAFASLTAALDLVSIWVLRMVLLLLLGGKSSFFAIFRPVLVMLLRHPGASIVLEALIGALVFFALKSLLLTFLWRRVLTLLADEQVRYSQSLFDHYLRSPFLAHVGRSKIDSQHNLIAARAHLISVLLPILVVISEAMVVAVIILYLALRAPVATLVLGAWLAGAALIFRLVFADATRGLAANRRRLGKKLSRLAHEALTDIKSVKIWGLERSIGGLFRASSSSYARGLAHERMTQQMRRFLLEPAVVLTVLFFYILLPSVGTAHPVMLGELTLFTVGIIRLMPAAQRISYQMHMIATHGADRAHIAREIAKDVETLPDRPWPATRPAFQKSLELRAVSLRYGEGEAVLSNVSITIARGEKIAIIGATGAGKTSLLCLITGLVEPTAGCILMDGEDVHPLVRFRQSAVGFVPQDISLLDGTVAANVTFGALGEQFDEERIWRALRGASLEKRVRAMPGGLQAQLGENGSRISGGERQRLGLARAFFQMPFLLILDEATSRLDRGTEDEVLGALLGQPDLTVIAVTHRTSTMHRFDRCFEIAGGRLTEIGRGAELAAQ